MKEHARDPFTQEAWNRLADRIRYVATDFASDRGEDKVAATLEELDRELRDGGQPHLLPGRPTGRVRDRGRGARRASCARGLGQADRREAVRLGPRVGARAERARPALVLRGRDLPDRPLPRQGDRPEHAGAAVCERHLRADLEPPVRRPRPDHRRRVDGHRGPRRLLRARGCDPRHLPEPPAPAARADGDGATDRLHRRLGAQREGEGAAGAAHTGPEVGRPRAVRPRLDRGRGGAARTARSVVSRRTRRPRRSSRRSSTSTTGAGRTRRSTSAPASGWRGARRRSRSSSSERRTRRSRRSPATACGRTCC